MQSEILIIPAHKIEKEKWNRCVSESPNGLIYAGTDYLDHLTDHWTGIVMNDYAAVMPVAWRKKYGIKYCYDVPFIQQLGIFSMDNVPCMVMMKALYSICRYGDYPFNFANRPVNASFHSNFTLSLNRSYEEITKGFSEGVIHSLKKAESCDLQYLEGSVDEAVDTCQRLYRQRIRHVKENEFENFKTVCKLLYRESKVLVRKVVDKNSMTLSIILLLKDSRRLYNILNGTLPEGRVNNANYFLLSGVWKEFQQTGLLFDFEGSDIPGIKAFYKKFGALDQPYQWLHFNRLPWPVNFFKS